MSDDNWWIHESLPKATNDDEQTIEVIDGELHVDGQGHDIAIPKRIIDTIFQRVPDLRRIDPQRG